MEPEATIRIPHRERAKYTEWKVRIPMTVSPGVDDADTRIKAVEIQKKGKERNY